MSTLEELVESGDIERLNDRLNEMNTVEIAEELARLDPEQRAVPAEATAFGPRDPGYLLSPEANWEHPGDDDANIAWARDVLASVASEASGGSYLNFPGMLEEGASLIRDSFGPTYDRLAELKREYDPDNVFRRNQNVAPAATR